LALVFLFGLAIHMACTLEQVDLIRERMAVGYTEAKQALDEAEGDVVQALAIVESRQQQAQASGDLPQIISEISQEVKACLEGRSIQGVNIRLGDETVKEVPVALGGVGAVLLILISALLAYLRLEVVTREQQAPSEPHTQ